MLERLSFFPSRLYVTPVTVPGETESGDVTSMLLRHTPRYIASSRHRHHVIASILPPLYAFMKELATPARARCRSLYAPHATESKVTLTPTPIFIRDSHHAAYAILSAIGAML